MTTPFHSTLTSNLRANAKHSRKGKRPTPDKFRVAREAQEYIEDKRLHEVRLAALVNEIESIRGYTHFDTEQVVADLGGYDWSVPSDAEFDAIKRNWIAMVVDSGTDYSYYDDSELNFVAPAPHSVRELLEQHHALPSETRAILMQQVGSYGRRTTALPARLRDLFTHRELLRRLESELSVFPAGRVAWYIAFHDSNPPDVTVWDVELLSYPEYVKFCEYVGKAQLKLWEVRLLRLLGTFSRVLQFVKTWADDPRHLRPDALTDYLHTVGAVLELPHNTDWNRKAWADFTLKYGPVVLRMLGAADEIERMFGVPRSLTALRRALENTPAGVMLLLGVGFDDYDREHYQQMIARAAQVKKVIPVQVLATQRASDDSVREYTMEVLPADSALGPMLGRVVDCCQYLGGAGHDAAVAGTLEPDAGFVVIKDPSGLIVAQSMFWIGTSATASRMSSTSSKPRVFVFDSLECLGGFNALVPIRKLLLPLYVKAAYALVEKYGFKHVNLGIGPHAGISSRRLEELGINHVTLEDDQGWAKSPYGYTDAYEQLDLLSPQMQVFAPDTHLSFGARLRFNSAAKLVAVRGTAFKPRALAKLLGALEAKVYPASVRLGWHDFLVDIDTYGADNIVVVTDAARKNALAYLVAFDDDAEGEGMLYISDIARDPTLKGSARVDVMLALLTEAGHAFRGRTFTAELRRPSRQLLVTFCDILDEREVPEYFDDGEPALFVRATVKPTTELAKIRDYVTARHPIRANFTWRT